MRILLLGANGQVGWELRRALAPLGKILACDRRAADLENPQQVSNVIREFSPSIIVNAAAYTAVDKAESEPERARLVNTQSVRKLAEECQKIGTILVHYSTDYVFEGTKTGPYTETDATGPLSVYGQTKLEGEEAIRQSGADHLIIRTSWVYAARGDNFVRTMLRLAKEREELSVVTDQVGAPTSAELIADTTVLVLYRILANPGTGKNYFGTYHLTAAGNTNWHQYAQFVLQQAALKEMQLKVQPQAVKPIETRDYPTPAKRPANSVLDCSKLSEYFSLTLPDWRVHLERTMAEILNKPEYRNEA